MNLIGYTATALSRNDIADTPTNKNVVDFAIVELKDLSGNLVVMYDDAEGLNPETQKTCDTNGQVTFFAEVGDYNVEINGDPSYITIGAIAGTVGTTAGINTQQFIDNFELKIFQSPTDNLTKVSTFAGGVGVVYEVRKTSDNSLATIYSDKDGVTSIPQNGTANVSNGDAEAVFYIADGDYTVTISAVTVGLDVGNINNLSLPYMFDTVSDMTASTIVFPVGKMLKVTDINTSYTVTAGISPRAESPNLTAGLHASFNEAPFVSNDQISGTQDTKGLSVVGCAVRITSGGEGVDNTFSLIDDTQHDPINCTSVTGDLQTINVFHEQPFSNVVGSCVVVPDETLAQRGIMCGGSIAADQSITTMTKRHQFIVDWQAGAANVANLVVDSFMDSSRYVPTDNVGGNGAYRIVMPRTLDGNRVVSPINRASPDAYVKSVSDTTADFFPYKSVTFSCSYNGSSWVLAAGQSVVTTGLSTIGVTCSNAGALITINHPKTLGTNSNALVTVGAASGYFNGNVYSETSTTTVITLVDSTGTPQTPVSGDSFNVRLEDILWQYGQSVVDIGVIKCSPTLDFKDISGANNFWLLGNHWALKSS